MAMPVRFMELCVSEKTKVKVWPAPMLALGETESAEGIGAGMVTFQVPLATKPVLVAASAAYRYTVLLPGKLGWKLRETVSVRLVPASEAELPAPLSVHWLFCWLPPPGITVTPPVEALSLASVNRLV